MSRRCVVTALTPWGVISEEHDELEVPRVLTDLADLDAEVIRIERLDLCCGVPGCTLAPHAGPHRWQGSEGL